MPHETSSLDTTGNMCPIYIPSSTRFDVKSFTSRGTFSAFWQIWSIATYLVEDAKIGSSFQLRNGGNRGKTSG